VEASTVAAPLSSSPPSFQFEFGTPAAYERLTVIPLFGTGSPADYLGLDAASALDGFVITEVDESGSVTELNVTNPYDRKVLLYEGEEVVGAKQNRTIARPILVPERTEKLTVPVSCVERGRWGWRGRKFSTSPHASYPSLRAAAHKGGQHGVWQEVKTASDAHGVRSPTQASEEMYLQLSAAVDSYVEALPLKDGQTGSLVLVDGDAVCLDWVSRPEVHADLYPKLLRGYAFEALSPWRQERQERQPAEQFVASLILANGLSMQPVGAGEALRLTSPSVIAQQLQLNGEMVALAAVAV
jgi:hypothetical protein